MKAGLAAAGFFLLAAGLAAAAPPDPHAEGHGGAGVSRPGALRLADLLAEAEERNPQARGARDRYEAARKRVLAAYGLDDPLLYLEKWPTGMAMAGLEQEIPFPSKLSARARVARAEAEIAQEEWREALLDVRVMVKHAYHHLFHENREIEINEENQRILENFVRTAEAGYAGGKTGQEDVLKAELERARLKNEEVEIRQERASVVADLDALLDRAPGTPLGEPEAFMPHPMTLSVADLIELAEAHRPAILRARAEVERAKGQRSVEAWDLAPDFVVRGTQWRSEDLPGGVGWGVMGGIRVPLWAPVRQIPRLEGAGKGVSAAEEALAQERAKMRGEVEADYAKVTASGESLRIYEGELLPQSQQAFRAATAAYESGRSDFLTLLDAQRTLRETKIGYDRTLVDDAMRLGDLERAVGVDIHVH